MRTFLFTNRLSLMKTLFLTALFFSSFSAYSQLYFPPAQGDQWESVSPQSLGWDITKIPALYNFLEAENSKALIVLKDGRIVIEKYFGTFTQDSAWYWASAGKTITALLTGKAQEEGLLSLQDKTSKYLGVGWTKAPKEKEDLITIRHQLTMTSGLDDGVSDPFCTLDTCLVYKADAGTRWAYHNAPYTLLDDVLSKATNGTLNLYTRQKLLQPTGMTGTWIPMDYNNVFLSKPRSMARFGLLMLNDGVWDSKAVLNDKEYVKALTNTSQSLNESYGYLWWLNGKSSYMVPGFQIKIPGSYAPNAPDDMVSGLGKNGQIVSISKSKGLVIVRMGDRPNSPASEISTQLCDQIWERIMAIADGATSVNDAKSETTMISPNPASDFIRMPESVDITQVQIVNTLGHSMNNVSIVNSTTLDISKLINGVYFLKINHHYYTFTVMK